MSNPSSGSSIFLSTFLLLILSAIPLAAQDEDYFHDQELMMDSAQLDDGGQSHQKAAACTADNACSGAPMDFINRILIQKPHGVRLVIRNGPVREAMSNFGCGETWSLYLPDDLPNRDMMLNQITVAEALGKTIWITYKKNLDSQGVAIHCEITSLYRGVWFNL